MRIIRFLSSLYLLLLLTGSSLCLAQSNAAYQVSIVEISGTKKIDASAVIESLKARKGMVTEETIKKDVLTLYKTGFFDNVDARIDTSNGRQKLVYYVSEKPTVRKVFIKGNQDVSESSLSEVLNFNDSRFIDRATVDSAVRKARSYYQGKGYYDVAIDYEIQKVDSSFSDIVFTVSEGECFRIQDIDFRGLKTIDPDDLEDVIQTSEYSSFSSWLLGTGRLNPEMLANDKLILRQYLVDHGFIDGIVREPIVEKIEDGLKVIFEVQEGDQFAFGNIVASGDLIDNSQNETLDGISAEKGEVFSGSKLRVDSLAISEKFGDKGFAFANVVPDTSIDRQNKTVDVTYSTDKGDPVYIDRIKISGNAKTYDNVIRREIRVQEQELYSTSKINRSKTILERLGYFEEIGISTEPGEKADEVNLLVDVREGSTGTFSVGAGYSTSDGAIINTNLSENNFLGTGRQLTLNADFGTLRNNMILSVKDRRLFDSFWSAGANAMATQRRFTDFDRTLTGGGLSIGYPLEELTDISFLQDVNFSVRYDYLNIEIDNVDPDDAAELVLESQGKSTASSITPTITRNTINNPFNPTSGSRQKFSVEIAGLGGSEDYYVIEAENTIYYPMTETSFGPIVFSMRNDFGYGEASGDEPFPLFKRYFPGGINSVRGYDARTLGPKDENGNEYGGSKQLINNFEFIFPVAPSAGLNGVVFYDIGQAFDDDVSIDFGDMREAYGAGIRWISPMGPIRLEFGFPIDREDGEDSMVTMFSFGAPL